MKLRSGDDFLDAEIMLKAKRLGLKICGLDVEFLKRKTGRSKVRIKTCFEFLANLPKARFLRKDPWGLHELRPGDLPMASPEHARR